MAIRDKGLYEKVRGFATFESYCKERWDMSRSHAYRFIDSVAVIENVPLVGQIPNLKQVEVLSKIKEPDQQKEIWQKAVETAPEGKSLISFLLCALPIPGRIR